MKNNFNVDNNVFSSQRVDNIAILRFKNNPLFQMTDIGNKTTLFEFLDYLSDNDKISVILIDDSEQKVNSADYVDLFRQIERMGIQERVERMAFSRFCNAVNQFIIKLVNCSKFIIHSDNGLIISLFMNISLACDYRIVDEDSSFQNSFFELGLVPKGGGTFFLPRMIGANRAREVLFSMDTISANKAL